MGQRSPGEEPQEEVFEEEFLPEAYIAIYQVDSPESAVPRPFPTSLLTDDISSNPSVYGGFFKYSIP